MKTNTRFLPISKTPKEIYKQDLKEEIKNLIGAYPQKGEYCLDFLTGLDEFGDVKISLQSWFKAHSILGPEDKF